MIIEYLKKHERASVLISILMIITAILLICKPSAFLTLVIVLFGIGTVIEGLAHIINYIFLSKEEKIYSYEILEGIFSIIAGILILAWKERVISIFPLLVSFWIMMKSLVRIQFAFQLKYLEEKNWVVVLILGVLSFLLGLLIFFNPWQTVLTITVLAGIMLLISEVVELTGSVYWLWRYRKI